MAVTRATVPHVRVRPTRGWASLQLHDIWEYRELLYFLVWRDIKVRYKQTALGAAWAILQPLLTMVVFTIFFGHLVKVPSDNIPYPIFSYTALVPWTFFSNGLTAAANSLVGNANLVSKVYFPRLTIPVAAILAGLVDFAIAFVVLLVMMVYYGVAPSWHLVFLPVFILLACVAALGVGLWLSAMNVQYRDVRYVVPFLIQLWLFATPIAYPTSLLHGSWRVVYGLNPMVGVVEGFRWSLLGAKVAPGAPAILSAAIALTLLVSGAFYFRRVERSFADVV